jgi:hypothetical protein
MPFLLFFHDYNIYCPPIQSQEKEWNELLQPNPQMRNTSTTITVVPMLTTKWDSNAGCMKKSYLSNKKTVSYSKQKTVEHRVHFIR